MSLKIRVYITSYNQKQYLIEAIESVLNQTLSPYMMISLRHYRDVGVEPVERARQALDHERRHLVAGEGARDVDPAQELFGNKARPAGYLRYKERIERVCAVQEHDGFFRGRFPQTPCKARGA